MNIQAINLELAKIGYKATRIVAKKAKQERQPWPIGPRVLGKPKLVSKWYKPPSLASLSKPYGKGMRLTGSCTERIDSKTKQTQRYGF